MTPIPPYEPPQERFTSPREVIGTPIGAKGNKRKPSAKRPAKQLKLVIKEEPPELDLSQPAPPASPTEDPLLLAGPREKSGATPRLSWSPATPQAKAPPPAGTSSPWEGSPLSIDLAPQSEGTPQVAPIPVGATSSPWEGSKTYTTIGYVGNDTSDTSMDAQPREDDIIFPVGEWSDSEDGTEEAFNQSGEYTGKFTTVRVPTKADPPSSITKERQDAWGRPVSPFPYPSRRTSRWSSPAEPSSPSAHVERDLPGLDDSNLDQMNLDTSPQPPAHEEKAQTNPAVNTAPVEASSPFNMTLGSQMSTPFAQARLITSTVPSMFDFAGLSSTPAAPVPRFSTIHRTIPDRDTNMSDDQPSPSIVGNPVTEMGYQRQQSVAEEEEEEEQFIDRELSHGLFDDAPKYSFKLPETPTPAWDTSIRQRAPQASSSFSHASSVEEVPEDSEGSEEDDGELDLGVIKITSEDPMAAARAAAILKLVCHTILLLAT